MLNQTDLNTGGGLGGDDSCKGLAVYDINNDNINEIIIVHNPSVWNSNASFKIFNFNSSTNRTTLLTNFTLSVLGVFSELSDENGLMTNLLCSDFLGGTCFFISHYGDFFLFNSSATSIDDNLLQNYTNDFDYYREDNILGGGNSTPLYAEAQMKEFDGTKKI